MYQLPPVIPWLLLKILRHFINSRALPPYLEEPATGLFPLSRESRPHNSITLPYDIFTWGLQETFSHQSFPANCARFPSHLEVYYTVKHTVRMRHKTKMSCEGRHKVYAIY